MSRLQYLLATGFYFGYSPIAPGTAGSLLALVIFWFLIPLLSISLYLLLITLVFAVGVWVSSYVEAEKGEDPSIVVIDEIVGMMIALIACPISIKEFITAFLAFRIFDVKKPFPVNHAERLPSGWGIMLDDVLAGFYVFLLIQILIRINVLDS